MTRPCDQLGVQHLGLHLPRLPQAGQDLTEDLVPHRGEAPQILLSEGGTVGIDDLGLLDTFLQLLTCCRHPVLQVSQDLTYFLVVVGPGDSGGGGGGGGG